MSYFLAFTLNGLPKTTNAGGRLHWAAKAKEAKLWRKRVCLTVASLNAAPKEPLKKATLTLTRRSAVEPDFDGTVSSFKHILDGLVDAGVIVDDKPSIIGQPTYKWEKVSKNLGHVHVIVEETS